MKMFQWIISLGLPRHLYTSYLLEWLMEVEGEHAIYIVQQGTWYKAYSLQKWLEDRSDPSFSVKVPFTSNYCKPWASKGINFHSFIYCTGLDDWGGRFPQNLRHSNENFFLERSFKNFEIFVCCQGKHTAKINTLLKENACCQNKHAAKGNAMLPKLCLFKLPIVCPSLVIRLFNIRIYCQGKHIAMGNTLPWEMLAVVWMLLVVWWINWQLPQTKCIEFYFKLFQICSLECLVIGASLQWEAVFEHKK